MILACREVAPVALVMRKIHVTANFRGALPPQGLDHGILIVGAIQHADGEVP